MAIEPSQTTFWRDSDEQDQPSSIKSVRFAQNVACVVSQVPSRNEMDPEDILLQWFSSEEFSQIKSTAKEIAFQARCYGFDRLLDNTLDVRTTSSSASSLQKWTLKSDMRRGLEMWINKSHTQERHRRRKMTIDSVLDCQEVLWAKNVPPEDMETELANVSELCSLSSKVFAARMGAADANAVKSRRSSTSHRGRALLYPSKKCRDGKQTPLDGKCHSPEDEAERCNRIQVTRDLNPAA